MEMVKRLVASLAVASVLTAAAATGVSAAWNGGHNAMGCPAASRTWYFAEGTTRPGFDEWVCLLNPNPVETEASFTYMPGGGDAFERSYALPPDSRTTVDVKAEVPAGNDVSLKIDAGLPVIAERPVYFRYNRTWTGGHTVVGASQPSREFYFAEGTCRPGFEPFLCLQNPGNAGAHVKITFMLGDGGTLVHRLDIDPRSRSTVVVKHLLGEGDDPAHDFSARVECTNGQQIVAERPVYFNYGGRWTGGHTVVGASQPGSEFYFAEGTCRPGFDPFICLQNPGPLAASTKVTYMLGNGASMTQSVTVDPRSRSTVVVKDLLGEGDDPAHDFSARVECTNGQQIVAERPVYFNYYSTAKWSLTAVGDTNLGGDVSPVLAANGFAWPWTAVGELMRSTTLTFANLECTMSYSGSPVPGKTFTFRGDPAALPFMRDHGGVDVVSQANNHARDYGTQSLLDSLAYLEHHGIAQCGAGADYETAHRPAFLEANGLRVAFLAYDDIGYAGWYAGAGYPGVCNPADSARLAADIRAAKESADLVVTSFHWGTERKTTPDARQTQFARFAVDCGADLVLGHHPHVVQGFEFYRGKLIANSLGNFVFNPGSEAGRYTVLTQLQMDSRGFLGATVYPVYISNARPQLMGGTAGSAWIAQVAALTQARGAPARVGDAVMYIP